MYKVHRIQGHRKYDKVGVFWPYKYHIQTLGIVISWYFRVSRFHILVFCTYYICNISIYTCETCFVGIRHMLSHYPPFSSLLLTSQARAFHSPPNKSSNYLILNYVRFWHTDICITSKHHYNLDMGFFYFMVLHIVSIQ